MNWRSSRLLLIVALDVLLRVVINNSRCRSIAAAALSSLAHWRWLLMRGLQTAELHSCKGATEIWGCIVFFVPTFVILTMIFDLARFLSGRERSKAI